MVANTFVPQVPLYGEASGLERDLLQRLQHLKVGTHSAHTHKHSHSQRLSAELDTAWRVESMKGSGSKQELWKRKVEKVADDVDKLSTALERHQRIVQRYASCECLLPVASPSSTRKQEDEQERQQLLGRRAARGAVQVEVDEEAQLESVNNSRRVAAEAYETGLAILGTMAGQRDRLKVWMHDEGDA